MHYSSLACHHSPPPLAELSRATALNTVQLVCGTGRSPQHEHLPGEKREVVCFTLPSPVRLTAARSLWRSTIIRSWLVEQICGADVEYVKKQSTTNMNGRVDLFLCLHLQWFSNCGFCDMVVCRGFAQKCRCWILGVVISSYCTNGCIEDGCLCCFLKHDRYIFVIMPIA